MWPMPFFNQNLQLRTVMDPINTYILDELTAAELDEFVQDGVFVNRQRQGLRVREFSRESRINQRYQIVATFKTSALPDAPLTIVDEEEYIAILESTNFPLYFITYEIDYTQFVYSNPISNPDQPIDHSIASRKHA